MINLLPPETKQTITYARFNRKLLHWVTAIVAALFLLGLIVAAGQVYLNHSVASYSQQVNQARETLKVQKLEETQKRVENITSSLKLVLQVLAREVLFSKLIRQVGAAMPPNTVLTNLQIAKLEGGIDLDAVSADYNTGTQIQVNLQDPQNKIFDKADIVNITCAPPSPLTPANPAPQLGNKYPCQVKIRALFSKNNPYLFVNNTGVGVQP